MEPNYEAKQCICCGNTFKPTGPNSQYCPECTLIRDASIQQFPTVWPTVIPKRKTVYVSCETPNGVMKLPNWYVFRAECKLMGRSTLQYVGFRVWKRDHAAEYGSWFAGVAECFKKYNYKTDRIIIPKGLPPSLPCRKMPPEHCWAYIFKHKDSHSA